MKRFIAIAAAASLLAGTALAQPYQQPPGHGGPPPGHGGQMEGPPHGPPPPSHGAPPPGHGGYDHGPPPPGYRGPPPQAREWRKGEHYDGRGEWVDWHREHLHEPPPGYEWVDTGAQFVLVAVATGIITDVLLHAMH